MPAEEERRAMVRIARRDIVLVLREREREAVGGECEGREGGYACEKGDQGVCP